MASSYLPKWKRFLIQYTPFLFKKCPGGNNHWFWDRLCFCQCGEHHSDWHGGIYDFQTKREYQHCSRCK